MIFINSKIILILFFNIYIYYFNNRINFIFYFHMNYINNIINFIYNYYIFYIKNINIIFFINL